MIIKIYNIIFYIITVLLTLPTMLITCSWIESTYYDNNIVNSVVISHAWLSIFALSLLGLVLTISATFAGILYKLFTNN